MTCTVTVLPAGRKLSAQPGENLLTLLRSANLAPEAPCGGNGKCGKCTVLIGGKPVLACGYTVSGDVTVHVTEAKTHARILTDGYGAEVELQPLRDGAMAAFDIGTTTVVCYLLEAGTGHLLAAASAVNPQQSYGADVISRIQRALAGEMEAQTRLIREQMGSLLGDACRQAGVLPETVGVISVVGNPCMQQLFLGIMPENLAKIPFAPVLTKAEVGEAGDIFLCCPHAALVTVPDISGYVGADTVGCVLASGLDREEKRTLLVDIGTNGEMVLGNRERMIACATAAGPALEGAKIRFGMRGEPGAIDHAALVGNTLSLSVIGGGEAAGICGSGLIDIAAVLLNAGVVNARGRLAEPGTALPLGDRIFETEGQRCFRLTDSVYLTQDDIRQLQMAKGAIASGIELMAAQLGGGVETIERVLLAGAFGSFIRPESACRIGLLPPQLLDRIQAIGNAAGSGARRVACSGAELQRAQTIADRAEFLELAALPEFQRTFAKSMRFCP